MLYNETNKTLISENINEENIKKLLITISSQIDVHITKKI